MSATVFQIHEEENSGFWYERLLEPATRARLRSFLGGYQRHYIAGSHIKVEGEESHSLYVVVDGWAALAKSLPEGQTQIIDFNVPGDLCNLVSADGATAAIGLEAATDTTIAVVPLEDWIALERAMPALAEIREKVAAATRSRIAERMLRLGRGTAEQRLAYAFLELAVRCDAVQNNKIEGFHIPVTQQRIGDFVGLTAIHVCRTLRRMKRHGSMSTSDRIEIVEMDVAGLEDLAGISVETLTNEIIPYHG